MEGLLTAMVNRALSRFIRTAEGQENLRVNVQRGGSLLLTNLELNLDPVMASLPGFTVSRAFAMRLHVTIPWTNLFGAPIQVQLDTVEVVLDVHDEKLAGLQHMRPPPTGPAAPPASGAPSEEAGASWGSWLLGWSGYLQAQLRKIAGNTEVVLKNVVIKLRTSRHVLTATCQSIDLVTTPLGQQPQSDAQDPEEWIYKTLEINGLTASISEATPGSVGGSRLARVPKASLRVAVPWPAGVMGLQEAPSSPSSSRPISLALELLPVDLIVSSTTLSMLRTAMETVSAVRQRAAEQQAAADAAMHRRGLGTRHGSIGGSLEQHKAPAQHLPTQHRHVPSDSLPRSGPGAPAFPWSQGPGSQPYSSQGAPSPSEGHSVALDVFGTPKKPPGAQPNQRAALASGDAPEASGAASATGPGGLVKPSATIEGSVRLHGVTLSVVASLGQASAPPRLSMPDGLALPPPIQATNSFIRDFADATGGLSAQGMNQQGAPGVAPMPSPRGGPYADTPSGMPPSPFLTHQPQPSLSLPRRQSSGAPRLPILNVPSFGGSPASAPDIARFTMGTVDVRANIVTGTGFAGSLSVHYASILTPSRESPAPEGPEGVAPPAASSPGDEVVGLRPGEGMHWALQLTLQGPLGDAEASSLNRHRGGINATLELGELTAAVNPAASARLSLAAKALTAGPEQPLSAGLTPAGLPPRMPAPGGPPGRALQQAGAQQPQKQPQPQAEPAVSSPKDGFLSSITGHKLLDILARFSLQRFTSIMLAAEGPLACPAAALEIENISAVFSGRTAQHPSSAPSSATGESAARAGHPPAQPHSEAGPSTKPASRPHSRNSSWGNVPIMQLPMGFPSHPGGAVPAHPPGQQQGGQQQGGPPPSAQSNPSRPPLMRSVSTGGPGAPMPGAPAPVPQPLVPAAPHAPPRAASEPPTYLEGGWTLQISHVGLLAGPSCTRPPISGGAVSVKRMLRECGLSQSMLGSTVGPSGEQQGLQVTVQGQATRSRMNSVNAIVTPIVLSLDAQQLWALSVLFPNQFRSLGPAFRGLLQVNLGTTSPIEVRWDYEGGVDTVPLGLTGGVGFSLGPGQQQMVGLDARVEGLRVSDPSPTIPQPSLEAACSSIVLNLVPGAAAGAAGLAQPSSPKMSGSASPPPPLLQLTDLSASLAHGQAPGCTAAALALGSLSVNLSAANQALIVGIGACLQQPAPVRDPLDAGAPLMRRAPSQLTLATSDNKRNSTSGAQSRPSVSTQFRFDIAETSVAASVWEASWDPRELNCLHTQGRKVSLGDTERRELVFQIGGVQGTLSSRTAGAGTDAAGSETSIHVQDFSVLSQRHMAGGRLLTMPVVCPVRKVGPILVRSKSNVPGTPPPGPPSTAAMFGAPSPQQGAYLGVGGASIGGSASDLPPLPGGAPPRAWLGISVASATPSAGGGPPTSRTDVSVADTSIHLDADLVNLLRWNVLRHYRRSRVLRGIPEGGGPAPGEGPGPSGSRVQGLESLVRLRTSPRPTATTSELNVRVGRVEIDMMTSLDPSEKDWYRCRMALRYGSVKMASASPSMGPEADRVRHVLFNFPGGPAPMDVGVDLAGYSVTCWSRTIPPGGHVVIPPASVSMSVCMAGNPSNILMTIRMPAVQCCLSMDSIFAFYKPMLGCIRAAFAPDPISPLQPCVLPDDLQVGLWQEKRANEPLGPMQVSMSNRDGAGATRESLGGGAAHVPPAPAKYPRWIMWRYPYARNVRRLTIGAGGNPMEAGLLRMAPGTGGWELVTHVPAMPDGSVQIVTPSDPYCDAEVWCLGWMGPDIPETPPPDPQSVLARLMVNPGSGLDGPEVFSFPAPQRLCSSFTMVLEARSATMRWCSHTQRAAGEVPIRRQPDPRRSIEGIDMGAQASTPFADLATREVAIFEMAPCTLRVDMPPETYSCVALRAGEARLFAVDPFSWRPLEVLSSPGLQVGIEYTAPEFMGDLWRREAMDVRQAAWLPPTADSAMWSDARIPRPNPTKAGMALALRNLEGPLMVRLSRGLCEVATAVVEDGEAYNKARAAALEAQVKVPPRFEDMLAVGDVALPGDSLTLCPPRLVTVKNMLPFDLAVCIPSVGGSTGTAAAAPPSSDVPLGPAFTPPSRAWGSVGGGAAAGTASWPRRLATGSSVDIPGTELLASGDMLSISVALHPSQHGHDTQLGTIWTPVRSPGVRLYHLECGPGGLVAPVAVSVSYATGSWRVEVASGLLVRNESAEPIDVLVPSPDKPGDAAAPGKDPTSHVELHLAPGGGIRPTLVGLLPAPSTANGAPSPFPHNLPTYRLGLGTGGVYHPWFVIGPEVLAAASSSSTPSSRPLTMGGPSTPAHLSVVLDTGGSVGPLVVTVKNALYLQNQLPVWLTAEFRDARDVLSAGSNLSASSLVGIALGAAGLKDKTVVLAPGQSVPMDLIKGRRVRFRCSSADYVAGGSDHGWGPWTDFVEAPHAQESQGPPGSWGSRTLPASMSPPGESFEFLLRPGLSRDGHTARAFPAVALVLTDGGNLRLVVHPRASVKCDAPAIFEVLHRDTMEVLCTVGPGGRSPSGGTQPPPGAKEIEGEARSAPRSNYLPWNPDEEPVSGAIVLRARLADPASPWASTTWLSAPITLSAEPGTMELRLAAVTPPDYKEEQAGRPLPTLKVVLRLATSKPMGPALGPKFAQVSILPATTVVNSTGRPALVVHRHGSVAVGPGESKALIMVGSSSSFRLGAPAWLEGRTWTESECAGLPAESLTDPIDLAGFGERGVAVLPLFLPADVSPQGKKVISLWFGLGSRHANNQVEFSVLEPDVAPVLLRNRLPVPVWAAIPEPEQPMPAPMSLAISSFRQTQEPQGAAFRVLPSGTGNGATGQDAAQGDSSEGLPHGDLHHENSDLPTPRLSEVATSERKTCWVLVAPNDAKPLFIPDGSVYGIGGVRGFGLVPGAAEDQYLLDPVSYSPAKARPPASGAHAGAGKAHSDPWRGNSLGERSLGGKAQHGFASGYVPQGPVLLLGIDGTTPSDPFGERPPESHCIPLAPGADLNCGNFMVSLEPSGPTVLATVMVPSRSVPYKYTPHSSSSQSSSPSVSGAFQGNSPTAAQQQGATLRSSSMMSRPAPRPQRLDFGAHLSSLSVSVWEDRSPLVDRQLLSDAALGIPSVVSRPSTGISPRSLGSARGDQPSSPWRPQPGNAMNARSLFTVSPTPRLVPPAPVGPLALEVLCFELRGLDVAMERQELESRAAPGGTAVQRSARVNVREIELLQFGQNPGIPGRTVLRVANLNRVTRRQYDNAVSLELVEQTFSGGHAAITSFPLVRLQLSPVQVQLDDAVLEEVVSAGREWSNLAAAYSKGMASQHEPDTSPDGSAHGSAGPSRAPLHRSDTADNASLAASSSSSASNSNGHGHGPMSRRYVWLGDVSLSEIRAILDLNLSHVGPQALPLVLDTRQSPLVLASVRIGGALFDPQSVRDGLVAHYTAEALLNAPQLLGSVSWLFNVTGLVHSLRSGLRDMLLNPLAQLASGDASTAAFLAELGGGTASLLRHLSSWSLSSLSGFSTSMARTLESLSELDGGNKGGPARGRSASSAPAPRQTLMGAFRRSIVQAVTLPISGALDLLGTASAVVAASAGLDTVDTGRQGQQDVGDTREFLRTPRSLHMLSHGPPGYPSTPHSILAQLPKEETLVSIPAVVLGVNGDWSFTTPEDATTNPRNLHERIGHMVTIAFRGEAAAVIIGNTTLFYFRVSDVLLEIENGILMVQHAPAMPGSASNASLHGLTPRHSIGKPPLPSSAGRDSPCFTPHGSIVGRAAFAVGEKDALLLDGFL